MSVKNKIKKIDNKKYKGLNFKTTEEIKVPDKLIDQIIQYALKWYPIYNEKAFFFVNSFYS